MASDALDSRLREYVDSLQKVLTGSVAAVYLVGGLALDDFSERFSNVDLVVVADGPIDPRSAGSCRRAQKMLRHAHRDAAVWYTTWGEVADGLVPTSGSKPSTVAEGEADDLDTPLTRALLRDEAVPLLGPDWPVVYYSEAELRSWCTEKLIGLAARAASQSMVMRTEVTPLVLQAARLAVGSLTGQVVSKSEAADAAARLVPHHFRRILSDAVGFRRGARTSMYWGPFERKYDARALIKRLAEAVS
ncbi:MAG: aminoglycoside adenylyltransferase domain-containing protein [Acidimicrobiales bacterium]